LALRDVVFDGEDKKGDDRRKGVLERELSDNTLVLDLRFGGLSKSGLLDQGTRFPQDLAGDDEGWDETGFRVRESEDSARSDDPNWRTCFRFVSAVSADEEPERYLLVEKWRHTPASEDGRSVARTFQGLAEHQEWAEREADRLACRLDLPSDYAKMLRFVACLHDVGKQVERWQNAFSAPEEGRPYAKTPGPVKFGLLDGYRHEFGSLPIVERDPEFETLSPDLQDLALHLVAAHHGFGRPLIGTNGCTDGPPSALEGRARDVALRFARLQRRWGPWGLAWWESLLRAADQRASRRLDAQTEADNG
jgi:CRISPR-associated endonuclease/helicase Cas3